MVIAYIIKLSKASRMHCECRRFSTAKFFRWSANWLVILAVQTGSAMLTNKIEQTIHFFKNGDLNYSFNNFFPPSSQFTTVVNWTRFCTSTHLRSHLHLCKEEYKSFLIWQQFTFTLYRLRLRCKAFSNEG